MSRRRKRKKVRRKKEKKRLSPEDNKLAWKMARQMTKMRMFDPEDVNKNVYCNKCGRLYCLGFDGVDVYCNDCFYIMGCKKEPTGGRVCIKCRREE